MKTTCFTIRLCESDPDDIRIGEWLDSLPTDSKGYRKVKKPVLQLLILALDTLEAAPKDGAVPRYGVGKTAKKAQRSRAELLDRAKKNGNREMTHEFPDIGDLGIEDLQ